MDILKINKKMFLKNQKVILLNNKIVLKQNKSTPGIKIINLKCKKNTNYIIFIDIECFNNKIFFWKENIDRIFLVDGINKIKIFNKVEYIFNLYILVSEPKINNFFKIKNIYCKINKLDQENINKNPNIFLFCDNNNLKNKIINYLVANNLCVTTNKHNSSKIYIILGNCNMQTDKPVISDLIRNNYNQVALFDINTLKKQLNFILDNYDFFVANNYNINKKICIIATHNTNFSSNILNNINKNKIKIYLDIWNGHNNFNKINTNILMNIADICYCEFMLGNSVYYSNNIKHNQKLIIRCHRFEITKDFYKNINLKKINKIIVINKLMKNLLINKLMFPEYLIEIHNLNINYLPDFDKKELKNDKYNLLMIGNNFNENKRLDTTLELLEKLLKKSTKYNLYLVGDSINKYTNNNYILYIKKKIKEMEKNIQIINKIPRNQLVNYYKKSGYICSFSNIEGCHVSVSEAMKYGCTPLIMRWEGAKYYYPNEYIFDSIDEIVNVVNKPININRVLYFFNKFYKNHSKKFKINDEIN